MALVKVNYTTIKYVFASPAVQAEGIRLEAATDIPEGSIVKCDTTGKAALAAAADDALGVARFPVAQGGQCVIEQFGLIEDKSAAPVTLTVGSPVFAGAAGAMAATGTVKIGTAVTTTKAVVRLG